MPVSHDLYQDLHYPREIVQQRRQADKALDGDIAGMTASLGVAFNSTLVALFISLILMLFMHLLIE